MAERTHIVKTLASLILALLCLKQFSTASNIPLQLVDPPSNDRSSLKYGLYTRENPEHPCILEETSSSLKECPLDSHLETIIIIHGYNQTMPPGSLSFELKDRLLQVGEYNVIVLDWQKYSGPPYALAAFNVKIVGSKVGEMINFLRMKASVDAQNVHLIAFSLGSHVAGNAGRKVPKLGRITAIEPAGPGFVNSFSKITYRDASFVQVIHTSSFEKGLQFGLSEPVGHMDFYVNGGITQPQCYYGATFRGSNGKNKNVTNFLTDRQCNHALSGNYFFETINSTDCHFIGLLCESYDDFKKGTCAANNTVVAEMGFQGRQLQGLPPRSKFYLRTNLNSPYCLVDGYVPGKCPDNSSHQSSYDYLSDLSYVPSAKSLRELFYGPSSDSSSESS